MKKRVYKYLMAWIDWEDKGRDTSCSGIQELNSLYSQLTCKERARVFNVTHKFKESMRKRLKNGRKNQ